MFLPKYEGPIYVIRRKDIEDCFLYDRIEQPSDIDIMFWTPIIFKAREFYTEDKVETFLCNYLKNRPCEIIMAK